MQPRQDDATAGTVVEAVARRSYGKLVAYLAARTRDVAGAEDALSDAFAAAMTDWSRHGCPSNPEAWLLTVARRRMIDGARRHRSGEAAALQWLADGCGAAPADEDIPDHRLALMFACAHPAIEVGIRAPLMLQAVLGLDAKRIASAFLMSPAAMGKRLVRAKDKIRQAGIPFLIPQCDELAGRLDTVLDAIYAAFADGWAAPGGAAGLRDDISEEALFLARLVAELLPDQAEALGLLAGMLYVHARRRARRSADGDYVPLAEQDTATWDVSLIEEAEACLRRASALRSLGRYQLEAALQSAHIERRRTGRDNAIAIVQLYDALSASTGSPVVAINRALAIADVHGVDAALAALPDSADDARLADYQPYWAARADLLARTGIQDDDAHAAYELAIGLEHDDAVRTFLRRRQSLLRR